jgi:hypothetical protein
MKDALAERGMTLDGWKRRPADRGALGLLVDKLVGRIGSSRADTLKRLYEESTAPAESDQGPHVLKNVLVAASQDYTLQQYRQEKAESRTDAKTRAAEALGKARKGSLVRDRHAEYSDDPRRTSGGLLTSWRDASDRTSMRPRRSSQDDLSEVVKCPDGYRVVQCTDGRRPRSCTRCTS